MRKLLILPLAALLLAMFAMAWPLLAAWQLRAAIKARDLPSIEARVDWPSLRANLKQTVAANLRDESRNPDAGVISRTLRRTLGPFVAERMIDVAVTPRTLARVLSGRLQAVDQQRAPPPGPPLSDGTAEADAEAASDQLSPRRLRWAFFEAPTRFRIEVADRREPVKRIVSVLALQGLRWKLVDVYYRSPPAR